MAYTQLASLHSPDIQLVHTRMNVKNKRAITVPVVLFVPREAVFSSTEADGNHSSGSLVNKNIHFHQYL